MPPQSPYNPQKSGMTGWLIKKGIAKDQKQAEIVLLSIAVIAVALTLLQLFGFGSGGGEIIDTAVDPAALP